MIADGIVLNYTLFRQIVVDLHALNLLYNAVGILLIVFQQFSLPLIGHLVLGPALLFRLVLAR